jgi:hypothetical protein
LRFRGVVFRVAALLLGLAPLVVFEIVARVAGWGLPEAYDDPFVGFSAVRPLFVPTADGSRYEIARNRLSHFRPDGFAHPKPAGEFRIFVLGGSTVQGRPYSIETSFTSWLELSLEAADPSRPWQVVNCGGVSYATYRLAPILDEVLGYQPDLIVFYEGHNEFLEDRTYAEIKHAPKWFTRLHEQAAGLRTYNLLRAAVRGRSTSAEAAKPQATLPAEAEARLDYKNGLNSYHYDPAWQRDCIAHFEFNLRRIVATCRSRGVPLVLVNPASNLDWLPFKAETRDDLSADRRAEVTRLWDSARGLYSTNLREAARLLDEATTIDDRHAGLWYDLGKCRMQLGEYPEARAALVRAKDADVCPLRILSPMNEIVLRVAAETATPLVDADGLFTDHSPGRINGAKWFVDHVHPTVEGHQLLADALADEVVRQGFVAPQADWAAERLRRYDKHLDGLPGFYFPEGARRLKMEQGWARGLSPYERGK